MNYSLQELYQLSKKFNFNRDTLEKVLRLSSMLEIFNTNTELKNKYVLKGGTAINICLFDLPRLSVDIDLDFNIDLNKEETKIIRTNHRELINAIIQLKGYTLDSKSRFSYTLDSYILKYTNSIGMTDYIKLELNYSNRIHIFDPEQYSVKSTIIPNNIILSLNVIELYASKIAALIGRTTARDIYDVYNMIENKIIKPENLEMLKKCAIFYLCLSNDAITIETLINNFVKNMENTNYNSFKRNLIPLLKVGTTLNVEELKSVVTSYIEQLFILSENEILFVNKFINGSFNPILLFSEKIAKRVNKHPMVEWKLKKS